MSGSKLVSGSSASYGSQAEVRVWGLAELDLQQTLLQPENDVRALVAVDGEVWGGVGAEVVAVLSHTIQASLDAARGPPPTEVAALEPLEHLSSASRLAATCCAAQCRHQWRAS